MTPEKLITLSLPFSNTYLTLSTHKMAMLLDPLDICIPADGIWTYEFIFLHDDLVSENSGMQSA